MAAACLQRIGTLRPVGATVLRSDNGLTFQRRLIRQACRDDQFQQAYIGTPTSGCITGWGTEARSNTARNKQPRWLDFRGALTDGWERMQASVANQPSARL